LISGNKGFHARSAQYVSASDRLLLQQHYKGRRAFLKIPARFIAQIIYLCISSTSLYHFMRVPIFARTFQAMLLGAFSITVIKLSVRCLMTDLLSSVNSGISDK
jgi:hypothetical protein